MVDEDAFLKKHAISPTVWEARGYMWWAEDDPGPVRDAYRRDKYGLTKEQVNFMVGLAKQSPGLIIERHPPEGMGLAPVVPEIRPDYPVGTDEGFWEIHTDDKALRVAAVCPEGKKKGEPLLDWLKNTAKSQKKHINAPRRNIDGLHKAECSKCRGIGRIGEAPPYQRCEVCHEPSKDGRRGCGWVLVDPDEVHYHRNVAKYVFPPAFKKPVDWEHDHEAPRYCDLRTHRPRGGYLMFPDALARHLASKKWGHKGEDVVGLHEHTMRVKDPDAPSLAKRLDVNPLVWKRNLIAERDTVFFAIEGCIKADAILSAGEAVFSVPSVTLWQAEELEDFARRYLVGKRVVVVPDADWVQNQRVIQQALLCRSFLRRIDLGIDAIVASPPGPEKGVDDFLAAKGFLDDLLVVDWYVPFPEDIIEWMQEERGEEPLPTAPTETIYFSDGTTMVVPTRPHPMAGGRKTRIDGLERDAWVAWCLSLHATETGVIASTLKTIARILGFSEDAVERAVKNLEQRGFISVEKGSLDARWGNKRSADYFDPGFGWVDPPEIKIEGMFLRAQRLDDGPLGRLRRYPPRPSFWPQRK